MLLILNSLGKANRHALIQSRGTVSQVLWHSVSVEEREGKEEGMGRILLSEATSL